MRGIHGQYFSLYAPDEKGGGDGGGAAAGAAAAGAGASGDAGAAGGAGAGGDAGAAAKGGADDGKGGSAAGDKGKDGDWGTDWRTKIAGDDPKALKQLERYQSPKDVWNKARSFEARLSSGELRSTLPKDATAEQVTQWRTENNIPESADKYTLELKDGLVIGKEDKPIIDAALATLHGSNANNAQASALVNWYYETQEKMSADRAAKDQEIATKTSDELHAEWGNEYRLNMNKITGLIDTMPAAVRDPFKYGRMADGTPLLANPGVLRALNTWARQINPVSTLVPNSGGDVSQAIDSEIASIEKVMKTDRKAYNADTKMQERLRELYDGRDRAKAQK